MSTNAEKALTELVFRNPQRNDFDAYELDLAGWGLGLKKERPIPYDFGVDEIRPDLADEFISDMKDLYAEMENGE